MFLKLKLFIGYFNYVVIKIKYQRINQLFSTFPDYFYKS
jgi:hypothetical protein